MKHILLLVAVMHTFTSYDGQQHAVARSIIRSQLRMVGRSDESDYKLTHLSVKRDINRVLELVDSAMKADGVANPLKDSLHFIAAYYVAGFMKGAVWRDTVTYYEWGSSGRKPLVRKRWWQISGSWKKLINAANTWDQTYFAGLSQFPGLYDSHGYNTLYTRWYAPGQPHKTHTFAFFLSPD